MSTARRSCLVAEEGSAAGCCIRVEAPDRGRAGVWPAEARTRRIRGMEGRHIAFAPGILQRWDLEVNEHSVVDDDPNRVTFAGAGRPATREEMLAFVAENNARYAREHAGE